MKFDIMNVCLVVGFILIAVSMFRAHRDKNFNFNVIDLIMVDGRVDRVSLAFMMVLAITTWLMIDLQLHGKMTEGYLTSYGAMWVIPLVSKVVFNKSDGVNTLPQQPTQPLQPPAPPQPMPPRDPCGEPCKEPPREE